MIHQGIGFFHGNDAPADKPTKPAGKTDTKPGTGGQASSGSSGAGIVIPPVIKREPFFSPGLSGKKIALDAGHAAR